MNTLIISYDLHQIGQNYAALSEAIRNLGSWCHCLGSTWIVKTSLNHLQAAKRLEATIDQNDALIVIQAFGTDASWTGFDKERSDWFKSNL